MIEFIDVERLRVMAAQKRTERLEQCYGEKIKQIQESLLEDISSPMPKGYVTIHLRETVLRVNTGIDYDLVLFLRDMGYIVSYNGLVDRRTDTIEVTIYWT